MTLVDRPDVRDAVERSADPLAARAAVERLVAAHPWLAGAIHEDTTLLDALVAVGVASRSLLVVLERDPIAVRMLDASSLHGAPVPFTVEGDDPARGLRCWKRREIVRIAARDLLGITTLREVGRELTELAQGCLAAALTIAAPRVPMGVIGMGKLGGAELNYASDVDVLFVHADDGEAPDAERAARELLRVMATPTPDGIVFRTDADLRPQGRAGALSRTIDGYARYWERWAQAWERQALLKARPVAGDPALVGEFTARAERFVWPDVLDPDAVREIRVMKARSEELLRRKGVADREVKRGHGGIRDIEFSVQLLQLVHGRADRSLRVRPTLDALEQLAAGGYVSAGDARRLDEAYVWLRTVEHRLQLVDEHQTHTIPLDGDARVRLARVLGFRDHARTTAVDAFLGAHRAHQSAVRTLHEKLFFAPVLDTLAGVGPLGDAAAQERLAAFGFRDVEHTRAALAELTAGLTRRSKVMQQLLPALFGWLSEAPDPDLGLLQLRRLSEGYTRASTLSRRFRETPVAAERACRLLGSSRVLGLALHRHPEVVDDLADDAFVATELSAAELTDGAVEALGWRADDANIRAGLRRFQRREVLRVGTRDIVGHGEIDSIGRELSHLADACLAAALRALHRGVPFAVIGLGRLGGCEMSYGSDLDVVFVHDGESAADFETAERVATRLLRAIAAPTVEGAAYRVDPRLRPEGGRGPLTRSLASHRSYYEQWGQTWELQALTKARFVAGDADLGRRYLEMIRPLVFRDPMPDAWPREIRRMKARIERERIPPREDPRFHLKLGRGSLSDVEFTVQLEQLRHGGRHDALREPATLVALDALVVLDILARRDADQLRDAYVLCERARNYRYLLTGSPGDALPADGDEAAKLARMLGYTHRPQQSLRDDYRRVTRRARAVMERVFYGRETA